jgi:adenosylhomocysteine nucleosidase
LRSFPAQAGGSRYIDGNAMIAVTFALPAESSEFLRRLANKSQSDRNGVGIARGNIGDREVEVMHTGVGEKACRERLRKFLEDQKFDLLISSGFAGALNDEFEVGDLLLAKNFSTIELNKSRSSFSGLQICTADLLTIPHLIDSADERNRTAHASGAAAVDMETEFIARACAESGIPLLSLRGISDTSREPFPVAPEILFNFERQGTDMAALARFLIVHPSRIPCLIQFARRIARVRKTLANALVAVVPDL